MPNNFITNTSKDQRLSTRVRHLIGHSEELKFLVGFFYFSGWQTLYEKIQEDPGLTLKILVGLNVDKHLKHLTELPLEGQGSTNEDQIHAFFNSARTAFTHKELDRREFYEQVGLFVQLLHEGRLIIRKTRDPNHAKLYIFKTRGGSDNIIPSLFITGSSNLTRPGLEGQDEFNVEVRDYGQEEAESWFDELWEKAIPITELEENKEILINILQKETQAANVQPFEAWAFILKTWLDIQQQKEVRPQVIRLLESKGYKVFQYQLDAVNQALTTIDHYNGAVIADVVGLGKSIVASAIGKSLGSRGLVLCSPGLIGEKKTNTGWWQYLSDFELNDWEVWSVGDLEGVQEFLKGLGRDIDTIVVDEAHRFRNEATESYELLSEICRGRTVLLLTATPFSNSPGDIFSLLKLFTIPSRSGLTLDPDLHGQFVRYKRLFDRLSYIQKNHQSQRKKNRENAERYYQELFPGSALPIDLPTVREKVKELSEEIRGVIEPVMIRRNRIDLKEDPKYKEEISDLPEVEPPEEYFFELTQEQSDFYDEVIGKYFGENGKFTGAIYQPFRYEQGEEEESDEEDYGERSFLNQQQRNLFEFMRRLLVKRFESSFGAFQKSLDTFIRVHDTVLKFIENSGGRFILDRDLMEKIYKFPEDAIDQELNNYLIKMGDPEPHERERIYQVNEFEHEDRFLKDIKDDKKLFEDLSARMKEHKLVEEDPKGQKLVDSLEGIMGDKKSKEPKRKVVIFTEYIDTVKHVAPILKSRFNDRVFAFHGNLTKQTANTIYRNFDAGVSKKDQKDEYDILLTSDKLAEGFNLNRAGAIINYDIPWNPTKVIQRVGRINRIGQKVFDELKIFNFFPTEKGGDVVRSREIATNKMFLIHNTLGEDARIFHPEEEPSASELYKRLHENPEDHEDESPLTRIRQKYSKIQEDHPEVIEKIEKLPYRIKTAKEHDKNGLVVVRKKGISIFVQEAQPDQDEKNAINQLTFSEAIPLLECQKETERKALSDTFWDTYEQVKEKIPRTESHQSPKSLRNRALYNLQTGRKGFREELKDLVPFLDQLIKDLRLYNTLPEYTLRRIVHHDLGEGGRGALKEFRTTIEKIRQKLGDDYLSEIEKRAEEQDEEVIVAVENV